MKKRIVSIVTDITIAAVIVLAVWIVGYKFPQEGIRAIAFEADQRTIIRNGVVYRNRTTDMETCVLNWDGTMDIYSPDQIDLQKLIEKGAYQSWIFGPSLLDENGKAKESFLTWNYIEESHPRTANHPYKPEHEVTDGIFIRENPVPGI